MPTLPGILKLSDTYNLNIISKAKHKQITPEQQYDLGEHTKEVSREKLIILAKELEIYKKEYNLIDFHDMITNFIKLEDRYRMIIVTKMIYT